MGNPLLAFCFGVIVYAVGVLFPWNAIAWIPAGFAVLLFTILSRPIIQQPLLLLGVAAGFIWTAWITEVGMGHGIPHQWVGQTLEVEGRVIEIPAQSLNSAHILLQTERIQGIFVRKKLSLSWYIAHINYLPPIPELGERWRFRVRLKPVHGLSHMGSLDTATRLRWNGIDAQGYIVDATRLARCDQRSLICLRSNVAHTLMTLPLVPDVRAFIVALLLGCEQLFSPDSWQVFQATGTTHLIAISGLHMVLIAGFATRVGQWILSRWAKLGLLFPIPILARIFGFSIAAAYGALAGFGLTTVRSLLMVFFGMFGGWIWGNTSIWQRLLWVICSMVMLDPLVMASAGFWLSVLAVAWIFYLEPSCKEKGWKRGWQLLKAHIGLFLGLEAIVIVYFHQVAWISLLINPIVIPWINLVILPLTLVGLLVYFISTQGFFWIEWCAGQLTQPMWHGLQWVAAHLSVSYWTWYSFVWFYLVLLAVALLFGRVENKYPLGLGGLLLIVVLCCNHPTRPSIGNYFLTMLDVGQGLALVLETTHHTMVYDTGPQFLGGFDAGRDVILPYLRQRQIYQLDLLMVSHGDNDHAGGAQAVLSTIPVKQILTSIPQKVSINADYCHQEQSWQWDGVGFQVLAPQTLLPYLGNNSSCVIRVSGMGGSVLLTGDIEKTVESELIQSKQLMRSDVLVVPHHGSRTSSTMAFLEMVAPKIALISAGAYNKFHHPNKTVVNRLETQHITMYSTQQWGSVFFQAESHEWTIDSLFTRNYPFRSILKRWFEHVSFGDLAVPVI